ncbi:MAG: ATP-binding cassette domain-containing protein [Candidatus Saccharimonas sp.]
MKSIIELTSVTKQFGKTYALRDVSFSIEAGQVVGFIGANGAGKTTTINAILGFISPTHGSVKVFDSIVRPGSAHRLHARIGYAAGDMELPQRLTGAQFLSFVGHQTSGDHSKRLKDLCERFQPQLDKAISDLSRGNKQKIALIAAFMTSPELILLDEPTSGLDPVMQDVFLDLIREEQAEGKTVFMSSHYLGEVTEVCSRVILMRGGEVIRDMTADEMLVGSGKSVKIVTGFAPTRPPNKATNAKSEMVDGKRELSFVFRGSSSELQIWVAGIKQLQDIEISEYNLEGIFKTLYETDGDDK